MVRVTIALVGILLIATALYDVRGGWVANVDSIKISAQLLCGAVFLAGAFIEQ